jgi:hypothetical protein
MTKSRAIKLHCLDCAGGLALEVTLCGITDCPLWEHRLGYSSRSRRYQERVTRALAAHPSTVEELRRAGVDVAFFSFEHAKKGLPGKNASRAGAMGRGDNEGGLVSDKSTGLFEAEIHKRGEK